MPPPTSTPSYAATAANRCPELSLVMEFQRRLSGADVFTQLVVVNIIAEPLMSLIDETKLEDGLRYDDETPGCKEFEDLKMDLDGKELV